ncbi:hypothetical protein LWI28_004482 [Acer negundo]|uniref:Uncharacterized protein n=1 Tax=Acer negundo TaxID=4023 RepID=A0AAD5ISM6_ACENE|nr:hypothetical protein LWI28_004482 [Acer negundo]
MWNEVGNGVLCQRRVECGRIQVDSVEGWIQVDFVEGVGLAYRWDCPKAYHPECVDKDDSVLESDVRWTCNWHSCGVCNKPPKFYCFCCPFAVCKCCLNDAGFAVIRNNKGLCDSCLELAWLIEEKADVDSNGCKVDFHDRDTVEFLFYDYWEIIKKEEGLTSEQVISAYNKLKKSSDSLEHDEVKEGTSESDYESQLDIFDDDIDGCKQIGRRKRMTGQLSAMKRKAISKKKEFIGWGSEPLLEFLASIGKDTSTEMSQYAVVDIITEYCRKNKLFDPEKSKKINFDARLNAVLRRKSANRNNLYNLLTPHLAENLELSEDELKCGPENIDEDDLVPRKRQQRLDSTEKSNTKAEVVNVRKSCFASIVPENIKLLYLRKSLVEELSKQLETFEAKVVGTFVRVKSDPNDFLQKNSHMLSQVTGVQKTSTMNSEIMLLVCNTVKEVPIRRLSDDNFSEMRNQLKDSLKTPEEERYSGKITRHDHFDDLTDIDNALNKVPEHLAIEERRRYTESCFGHLLRMDRGMKFSAGIVHRLLIRELHHDGPEDEMRFLLGRHSVRFSKVEFCLITGLKFGELPDTSTYDMVENGIHQRYFEGRDEVEYAELKAVLRIGVFSEQYDAVKLCLLYMLNWILMGLDEREKVPVWQFRLVEDLDAFDAFPWGAHVYRRSIYGFKHALDGRRRRFEQRQRRKGVDVHTTETYNIYGLTHALLIFAFEVIPELGNSGCGKRREIELSPRILKWELNVCEGKIGADGN